MLDTRSVFPFQPRLRSWGPGCLPSVQPPPRQVFFPGPPPGSGARTPPFTPGLGVLLLATAAGRPLLARTGTPGRFCHSALLCADSAVGLRLLSVHVAYLCRASSRTPRPRCAVVSACWCSLVLSGLCVGDHVFCCPGLEATSVRPSGLRPGALSVLVTPSARLPANCLHLQLLLDVSHPQPA